MAPRTIRPDQIADPDVLFANGPGADLNINCSKRLIGLTCLAEKVEGRADRGPGPDPLRAALALLAGASVPAPDTPFAMPALLSFWPVDSLWQRCKA